MRHLDTGVGERDVDAAERSDRLGNRRLERFVVAQSASMPIAFGSVSAKRFAVSPSMSTSASFAPFAEACRATSAPMPLAPPVTTTRLPCRLG